MRGKPGIIFASIVLILILGTALPFLITKNLDIPQALFEFGGWYGAIVGFFALIMATAAQLLFLNSGTRRSEITRTVSIALSLKWEIQKNLLYLHYAKTTLESKEKKLPLIEPKGQYHTSAPSHFTVNVAKSALPAFDTHVLDDHAEAISLLHDDILRDVYIFYAGLSSMMHMLSRLEFEIGGNGKIPNNLFGGLMLGIFACSEAGRAATGGLDKVLTSQDREIVDLVRGTSSQPP